MSTATQEQFRFPTLGNHMGVGIPVLPHPSIYETLEVRLDVTTDADRARNVTERIQVVNSTFVEHARDRHWSFARELARAKHVLREKATAEKRKADQRSERSKRAAETRARNKAQGA